MWNTTTSKMAVVANSSNDDDKQKNIPEESSSEPISPISFDESALTLLSEEKLDRSSPELWPEQIPGVCEFASMIPDADADTEPEWLQDLDHDDISVLQGFGSLTAAALLEKVKDLQNLAYQLGLEEAKEMTRGRFLHILSPNNHRR